MGARPAQSHPLGFVQYQLCWGHWEMGTAISTLNAVGWVALSIQQVARRSSNVASLCAAAVFEDCCYDTSDDDHHMHVVDAYVCAEAPEVHQKY